jgi:hypothetical protein
MTSHTGNEREMVLRLLARHRRRTVLLLEDTSDVDTRELLEDHLSDLDAAGTELTPCAWPQPKERA